MSEGVSAGVSAGVFFDLDRVVALLAGVFVPGLAFAAALELGKALLQPLHVLAHVLELVGS